MLLQPWSISIATRQRKNMEFIFSLFDWDRIVNHCKYMAYLESNMTTVSENMSKLAKNMTMVADRKTALLQNI
jgi:hypothetical protein